MDEADKLCDRIAIVDHGELKALDSPLKLKASIPGKNVIEVELRERAAGLARRRSQRCPASKRVTAHDDVFRIASANGPATTTALLDTAAQRNVAVQSLSVQSTTLDDVFVHYTGRALRDALQEASPQDSPVHDAAGVICIEPGPSSNASCGGSGAARRSSSSRWSSRSCSSSSSATRSAATSST